MAKIGRPGLSREKRVELWERWKSGQCASDIARELARTKGAIHHVLAFKGGIAPVARRRGSMALVLDEREEISRGIAAGRSIRRIAASLGRSPSTVSREMARHGGRSLYRATEADARAWEWALRPTELWWDLTYYPYKLPAAAGLDGSGPVGADRPDVGRWRQPLPSADPRNRGRRVVSPRTITVG